MDVLNPGWEASIHCFRLQSDMARQINTAVTEEALRLEKANDGLKVSNLGGYHSREQLFCSKNPSTSQGLKLLERVSTAAIQAADQET